MKGPLLSVILAVLALSSLSCQSAGAASAQGKPSPSTLPPAASGGSAEAQAYFDKAQDALDANHLSEAIRAYVSVLALADQAPADQGLAQAAGKANAELSQIATRLSLEPTEAWVTAGGAQIEGESRSIGKEGALMPAVYLYENFGTGKAPIADAPIAFEFVKNGGTIIPFVTTDSLGRANTSITRLDSPGDEALVRATAVFKAKGYSYAFKTVSRDFSYLPPAKVTVALSLAILPDGTARSGIPMDGFASALKSLGLQVIPASGSAATASFKAAFDGTPSGAAALSGLMKAPYLALSECEVYSITQMKDSSGAPLAIYFAFCNATLRLVRSDGTVIGSVKVEAQKAAGSNEAKAIEAVLSASKDALLSRLTQALPDLRKSLLSE